MGRHDAGGSSSSIPESFESTRQSWRVDRARFSTFYLPRSGTPLLADQITLDPRLPFFPSVEAANPDRLGISQSLELLGQLRDPYPILAGGHVSVGKSVHQELILG